MGCLHQVAALIGHQVEAIFKSSVPGLMRPYLKLVDFGTPPWSEKDPQKVPKLVEVGQSFVIFYVTFIYFTSN